MEYNNTIFRKAVGTIRYDDGDTGTAFIVVTAEANGYAVFDNSVFWDEGKGFGPLVYFGKNREAAIEYAVDRAANHSGSKQQYIRDDYSAGGAA